MADDDEERVPAELRPTGREKLWSSTPFLDLIVDLLAFALILGGGLAAIFALGYVAEGSDRGRAWPFVILLGVLLVAWAATRAFRDRRRR